MAGLTLLYSLIKCTGMCHYNTPAISEWRNVLGDTTILLSKNGFSMLINICGVVVS